MNGQDPFQSENQYEYVFSSGEPVRVPEEPKKEKQKKGFGYGLIIGIAIALVCSFFSGIVGMVIAYSLLSSEQTQTGNYLYTNRSVVVEKASSSPSVFGSAGENVLTVSQVVANVRDSIVVIESTARVSYGFGVTNNTSSGSGVIISQEGYVLTCNHVVEGATSIKVTLTSGNVYDAALVGSDSNSDLAVLKINPGEDTLTSVRQGCSGDLVVGESVVAIGNPLGTLSWSVTGGIISSTARAVSMSDGTVMTLLQTDAAINSGNSGGGLFNLRGELIGIVNAKYSQTGVEGLAFAIPIDSAYTVELDLIQYGYVRGVPYSGLELQEVTRETYRYPVGVYVISSEISSDFKYADRIVSVNGTDISSISQLKTIISDSKVGDVLNFVLVRDGKEINATLTLVEYVPEGVTSSK